MTEDLITGLELGRSRAPTSREAIVQQLVGGWLTDPHGDRRDGAESIGIETQEVRAEGKNNIVRVLILRDDIGDLRTGCLSGCPAYQISECVATAEGLLDVVEELAVDCFDRAHRDCPHESPTRLDQQRCHG
jgi:hypothetical protein